MVKEIIHFDHLHAEVQAWGDMLRDTLHGFSSPEEEQQYQRTMNAILREIVSQVTVKLNHGQERDALLEKVGGVAFSSMMEGLLAHWNEIKNIQGYIAASLRNLQYSSQSPLLRRTI